MPEDWQIAGFGLYLHWPFCQAKCPYCDFNSHVVDHIDQARWQAAYLSEIRRLGQETEGRVLRSVYFGGGTPSLMDAGLVQAILDEVRATWTLANDCEITLEANPTSVESGRFAGYREAGVNRVSIGIQALNDTDLRALGRLHTIADAQTALSIARDTFDRVSFDLIYARQNQSLLAWQTELARALDMVPDHLSLYQLTIEDGTAFGDRFSRGLLKGLPDEDLAADMYFATQEICQEAGLPAYEVSNHAIPGTESRHNLIYWQSGDWIGIGPGAHGRLTLEGQRLATSTPLSPLGWLGQVERSETGENLREALSPQDVMAETIMMGLRTLIGIDLSRIRDSKIINNINMLIEDGYLEVKDGQVCVAPTHRPVLNAVLRQILND